MTTATTSTTQLTVAVGPNFTLAVKELFTRAQL
jgi:hypothetical protein